MLGLDKLLNLCYHPITQTMTQKWNLCTTEHICHRCKQPCFCQTYTWACPWRNDDEDQMCDSCMNITTMEFYKFEDDRAEEIERAFKAGYHCQWLRHENRYIFDPAMKPGDPDGAFAAWRASEDIPT